MNRRISLLSVIFIFILKISLFSQPKYYKILLDANNNYENGKYVEAISDYLKISKRIDNGYLFYNIGTCYLKINQIGKSLFYFEKAKFLIPLNKELNNNILIANSKIKDNLPKKNIYFYLGNVFFITKILSLRMLFFISLILYYVTIFSLIFYFYKKKKTLFSISFVLFLIFILNFLWSYYSFNYLNFGFVINDDTKLLSDFNTRNKIISTINQGVKIYVLEKHKDFLYVMLQDGKKGWLNKNNVIVNNFKNVQY